jgi:hypothetical protein
MILSFLPSDIANIICEYSNPHRKEWTRSSMQPCLNTIDSMQYVQKSITLEGFRIYHILQNLRHFDNLLNCYILDMKASVVEELQAKFNIQSRNSICGEDLCRSFLEFVWKDPRCPKKSAMYQRAYRKYQEYINKECGDDS